MSGRGVSQMKRKVFFACIAGVLSLAACGGSKSDSGDATGSSNTDATMNSESAGDSAVAADPAAKLKLFCADAQQQAGTNLAETDDANAIAQKLADNAATLAKLAVNAPDDVKDSVTGIATAAKEMADAVAADPSLANINDVVQKYSTPDFDASSKKVEEFIKTNCGE